MDKASSKITKSEPNGNKTVTCAWLSSFMKTTNSKQPARPASPQFRLFGFTLIELLVVISIIAILAGIALPVFSQVQIKGAQTKDLSNGKQIALGLRLYAQDNNGIYPTTEPVGGSSLTYANDAFRNIVPQYVPQEKIFYLAKSAWTPQPPDENTSGANCLQSGENNFAYVTGLSDSSNPSYPLIADGFSSTVGSYASPLSATVKGAVWGGKNAIVIYCDGSGQVQTCKSLAVFGPVGAGSTGNIFSTSTTWMPSSQILNPQ
jgi:prepilin-type N-terminal cleavage/methylation domain-containing protein